MFVGVHRYIQDWSEWITIWRHDVGVLADISSEKPKEDLHLMIANIVYDRVRPRLRVDPGVALGTWK